MFRGKLKCLQNIAVKIGLRSEFEPCFMGLSRQNWITLMKNVAIRQQTLYHKREIFMYVWEYFKENFSRNIIKFNLVMLYMDLKRINQLRNVSNLGKIGVIFKLGGLIN